MTLHPGRVTLQSRRVAGRASRSGVPNLTELTMQHVLQPGYDYADEFEFLAARFRTARAPRRRVASTAPLVSPHPV